MVDVSVWARGFSEAEIALVRQKERTRRDNYYRAEEGEVVGRDATADLSDDEQRGSRKFRVWEKMRGLGRAWRRGRVVRALGRSWTTRANVRLGG